VLHHSNKHRRYALKPPSTAHNGPPGGMSYCGAYFAPLPEPDGSIPEVTCKRCLRAMAKLESAARVKDKMRESASQTQ